MSIKRRGGPINGQFVHRLAYAIYDLVKTKQWNGCQNELTWLD